jgi:hypothetical protein
MEWAVGFGDENLKWVLVKGLGIDWSAEASLGKVGLV